MIREPTAGAILKVIEKIFDILHNIHAACGELETLT